MAGKHRSQRVKLAPVSAVAGAASNGFRRRQQTPQQMADLDYFHIKNTVHMLLAHKISFFGNINMEPKSMTHLHAQILHLFFKLD